MSQAGPACLARAHAKLHAAKLLSFWSVCHMHSFCTSILMAAIHGTSTGVHCTRIHPSPDLGCQANSQLLCGDLITRSNTDSCCSAGLLCSGCQAIFVYCRAMRLHTDDMLQLKRATQRPSRSPCFSPCCIMQNLNIYTAWRKLHAAQAIRHIYKTISWRKYTSGDWRN